MDEIVGMDESNVEELRARLESLQRQKSDLQRIVERQKQDLAAHDAQNIQLEKLITVMETNAYANRARLETLEEQNFYLKMRLQGLDHRLTGPTTHVCVHERCLALWKACGSLEAWQCQNNSQGDRATGASIPPRSCVRLIPPRSRGWPQSSARWMCATPGCKRERQYEPGCDWDRCCKEGFLTGCQTHEPWCNKDFGE